MFGTNSLTLSVPDTAKYLNDIQRNSIGMDEWFRRFDTAFETHTNYPPYNLVKEDSITFRLEIALAGFKREEIEVTTEWNKLLVEAKKSDVKKSLGWLPQYNWESLCDLMCEEELINSGKKINWVNLLSERS